MIRKIILMVLMTVASVNIWGQNFTDEVSKLKFVLNNGVAEVEGNKNNNGVTGDLVIPPIVTYKGVDYSVTKIRTAAFSGAKGLTSVVIPSSVTVLENKVFSDCTNLRTVIIKGTLSAKLNDDVFKNCSSLESVTFYSTTPPEITSSTFSATNVNKSNFKIYVPAGTADNYKGQTYWKDILDKDTRIDDGTSSMSGTSAEGFPIVNVNTVSTFTYQRTFSDMWQAIYLPFSMDYDEWKDQIEIAKLVSIHRYYDDDGNETGWLLEVVPITSGSTMPNIPYVARTKTSNPCSIHFVNKTVCKPVKNSISCWSTELRYTFEGTITEEANLNDPMWYVVSGGSLKHVGSAASKLRPFRWILKTEITDPSGQIVDYGTTLAKDDNEIRIRVKMDFDDVDPESTGIVGTSTVESLVPVSYVSMDGVEHDVPQRGVNIVKMSDGTIRKVVR